MTRPETAPNGPETAALTPKQEAAALATARGLSVAEAARRAGCGQRTLKTWRAIPAFRQRVVELRAEMTADVVGRLTDGMGFATTALRKLLSAKSEAVRLSAARTVLEMAVRLRESAELEAQVQALRESVAQLAANRGRMR